MAIVDSTAVVAQTGLTFSGADATSITTICTRVSSLFAEMLLPAVVEPVTITDEILDAPLTQSLLLMRRPARSVTSVYYNPDALGVVANFTSDHLLTAGEDYRLKLDDPVNGISRSGIVTRLNQSAWGVGWKRYPGTLGKVHAPIVGAIKVTYAAGFSSVPAFITGAAVDAVMLVYNARANGAPFTSESWNGRSQSIAQDYLKGVLNSPDVMQALGLYRTPHFA